MKFQFFIVIALMCVAVSVAKWCNITNEGEARAYKSISPEYVTELIPVKKQMFACCEGYKLVGKECVPICEDECTETKLCVEPKVCGCPRGYLLVENKCEPICELECDENAYCSAPGVCQCKPGFFRNEADKCQNWCKFECKNGDCVGPNNCSCHQGFVKVDGMCIPDCESGCRFGDCQRNGMCICWPGFVYNSTTRNCHDDLITHTTRNPQVLSHYKQAEKLCPEYCPNGICIDGLCKCPQGFVRVDYRCASLCSSCQFGECVEENVCHSNVGSVRHPPVELTSIREPEDSLNDIVSTTSPQSSSQSPLDTTTGQDTICATGCWAGTCVNGVCQCTDGLVLSGENECVRPCEVLCKNGVCNQDNVCECQPGYIFENGGCVPVCAKDCKNGFCMAPDRCECHLGYILNTSPGLEHICLPTCDGLEGNEGCLNGTCVAVNKCECLEGLIYNPDNRFECIPYPVDVAERQQKRSWYIYVLLGVLIILLMIILFLLALRKFHQDTYNVDKVEKRRATVQYQNCKQASCVV